MNKREQIIILLAAALAIYGILDYFVLSKKKAPTEEEKIQAAVVKADTFAATARAKIMVLTTQGNGRDLNYTMAKAETPWPRDPFISRAKQVGKEMAEGDIKDMVYSGFIKLGNKMLGIINGMEYGIGELIVDIGYKVHKITTTQVTLMTESNKQIIIYLQED